MRVEIIVNPRGAASCIYTDALSVRELSSALGADCSIRRASMVEPTAEGAWEADMSPSDGPVLGPYPSRGEALAAEVEWLRVKMEGAT